MRAISFLAGVLVLSVAMTLPVFAHCEIPCGIYDDEARISMIAEHARTIEKSMNQIIELSKEKPLNYNQMVRWVQNKEDHANQLQEIVSQYFMTQRIKPVGESDKEGHSAYMKKLRLLHEMLVYAMKAKQTTDLGNVEKLRSLLSEFKAAYFAEHEH